MSVETYGNREKKIIVALMRHATVCDKEDSWYQRPCHDPEHGLAILRKHNAAIMDPDFFMGAVKMMAETFNEG